MPKPDTGAPASPALLESRTERLVVMGFRLWLAGYEYNDIDCWETAWNLYARELPREHARTAFADLQHWIRGIRGITKRTIRCLPHCCRHVCRDECLALSMVSAVQADDLSTARIAAHHLTGAIHGTALSRVTDCTDPFASSLEDAGLNLVPISANVVCAIAEVEPQHHHSATRLH